MRPAALVLLAFLATAPAPQRLSAQFRVPRPKVPNPITRVTQAVTPGRQPTFDDRVLEMTDARLTALIRGLRAEQQQRPAIEAGYKKNADARAAYEVSIKDRGNQMSAMQQCLITSPEYRAIYGDTVTQRKTADRLQRARDRGDDRTVTAIEDSLAAAMTRIDPQVMMGMVAAQQRCTAPVMNAAPTTPTPQPPDAPQTRMPDSLRIIGVGASGLTDDQYSVMRERVLAFLTVDEEDLHNSMYVFSGTEMTALKTRRAELQRYQTLLVDG
jgi:hypothetical protein